MYSSLDFQIVWFHVLLCLVWKDISSSSTNQLHHKNEGGEGKLGNPVCASWLLGDCWITGMRPSCCLSPFSCLALASLLLGEVTYLASKLTDVLKCGPTVDVWITVPFLRSFWQLALTDGLMLWGGVRPRLRGWPSAPSGWDDCVFHISFLLHGSLATSCLLGSLPR